MRGGGRIYDPAGVAVNPRSVTVSSILSLNKAIASTGKSGSNTAKLLYDPCKLTDGHMTSLNTQI